MIYNLPVNYEDLTPKERKEVRELYNIKQDWKCLYCGCNLLATPPKRITDKRINWNLFPPNFLRYPIHLQHNHDTGMTEGSVHSYCNAVMWQYDNR